MIGEVPDVVTDDVSLRFADVLLTAAENEVESMAWLGVVSVP